MNLIENKILKIRINNIYFSELHIENLKFEIIYQSS